MKNCCEEMKVLLETMRANKFVAGKPYQNGSIQFFEDSESELSVLNFFNIIFRFCPYCGAAQAEAKDTGISFLDELKAKLFPKELDEKMSLSCRTVLLEETVNDLQQFYKNEAPKFAKKIQQ